MSNEKKVYKDAILPLQKMLDKEEYVIDKSGSKLVELRPGYIHKFDPRKPLLEFEGRKSNKEYIEKESKWYASQDLSINGWVDDVKIWTQVCTQDEKREVNSNYGYLVFSEQNGSQFDHCYEALIKNPYSRQAVIFYNRPSMHVDYNRNGMSDFTCTFYQQFFIREDNKGKKRLYCINDMRSNDLVFGFLNDIAYFCEVYMKMYKKLKKVYKDLKVGYMDHIANSLHVYERHFDMLKNMRLKNDKK